MDTKQTCNPDNSRDAVSLSLGPKPMRILGICSHQPDLSLIQKGDARKVSISVEELLIVGPVEAIAVNAEGKLYTQLKPDTRRSGRRTARRPSYMEELVGPFCRLSPGSHACSRGETWCVDFQSVTVPLGVSLKCRADITYKMVMP